MQMPIFKTESIWQPPTMADLPSWKDAKRIAIDTETRDEHLKELGIGVRRGGYIVGVSFGIEDHKSYYLPIAHDGGDNLPRTAVLNYLKAQAKVFRGDVVGANLSYDLDYWLEAGINFHADCKFLDIQIADPLIYELHRSYSLANIAKRYNLPGKDETLLNKAADEYGVSSKSGLWKLPARYVGAYAEGDADRPLRILRRQERLIEEHDLEKIWELETDVLPVLVNMRRRGILIDQDKLKELEKWTLVKEAEFLNIVKNESGYTLGAKDLWNSRAMVPVFDKIGVTLNRTKTGQPQINAGVFKSINHPVVQALEKARKLNKLRTTFAASIRRYMVNGRIHCTFNQIAQENAEGDIKGVRFGRLSATDPNMQQQPNPEKEPEISGEWRKIYMAEPGALWASCDFSQQEPRWTTHYAAVMDLPKAKEMAQAYHDNPDLDNHQFMSDLTGLERSSAKALYLGLCYGEGGAKLCETLGLPTRWALSHGSYNSRKMLYFDTQDEAFEAKQSMDDVGHMWRAAGEEGQGIIDQFNERAPFIGLLAKAAQKQAARRGFIITGGGRKLHFPKQKDGRGYDWIHKALNRLIQGTSADQMKKALVEIDRAGYFINLQVHDEANASVSDERQAKEIGDVMRTITPARVPFKVDVETGPSWGEVA